MKDDEFREIVEDIETECSKYGAVRSVTIPRPSSDVSVMVPGLGKVYVEFAAAEAAEKARKEIEGRQFAGRIVVADYLPVDKYEKKEFS